MDVDALTGIVTGSAIVGLIIGVIGIVIFYFVVKAAVRNGTIEAHEKMGSRSMGTGIANPRTDQPALKAAGTVDKNHCPNCGAKRPKFGGALDDVKCSQCGYAF